MTGLRTVKEQENEKRRGKRRYLERLVEEQEANKDIKEYQPETTEFPEREDDRTK